LMTNGEQIEHPAVQVQVRGHEYTLAWEKMDVVKLALDGARNVSVVPASDEAYILQNVSRSGPVLPMGSDDVGDRHYFAVNATITMTEEE